MRRVAITGIACAGAFGWGASALGQAAAAEQPCGAMEEVVSTRGRSHRMRVARLAPFARDSVLPPRTLRRMGDVSQIWTICCLQAAREAGMESPAACPAPPERRGTFLGTGLGCTDTTWDYLKGLNADGAGMGNPFLFSESVASAPAGHSAIELDTRGTTISFTCADASAATAVAHAARAIAHERLDAAWCGGIDTISEPVLHALAPLGVPFVSEGAVCFLLEPLAAARARGARTYAELAGWGAASDPAAGATSYGADPAPIERALRAALEHARREAGQPPPAVSDLFLHAAAEGPGRDAELSAARRLGVGAAIHQVGSRLGALGAAGGFPIAAAALQTGRTGAALTLSTGWGGTIASLLLA
jgi:3-oxoacyl-(acyl-carrier-protein) synthase